MIARLALAALLLFSASLTAAQKVRLSIEQLRSFVESSLRLKHPDKQIGVFLSKVELTARLEDRVIEEFIGLGAGPKTVEELKALGESSSKLPPPPPPAPKAALTPIPPPPDSEQRSVLAEVREWSMQYSKTLPDFICTQVTRRYGDPSGMEFWQAQDTLVTRLSYFNQKEDYKLVMINNQVTDRKYDAIDGASSTGEFGSLLRGVFEEKSRTEFHWERWATLRGRRAYVFSYRVAQPFSDWRISYQRTLDIVAGYRGLLFVDKATRHVLRITLNAEGIPPTFPVQEAATTLDYDFVTLSDQEFLLPLKAVVRMRQDKYLTKNDVEFRMYRKFSADTQIKFDTPEPLPEDQTKETPPK